MVLCRASIHHHQLMSHGYGFLFHFFFSRFPRSPWISWLRSTRGRPSVNLQWFFWPDLIGLNGVFMAFQWVSNRVLMVSSCPFCRPAVWGFSVGRTRPYRVSTRLFFFSSFFFLLPTRSVSKRWYRLLMVAMNQPMDDRDGAVTNFLDGDRSSSTAHTATSGRNSPICHRFVLDGAFSLPLYAR